MIRIERASLERMDEAYAIVREYYEAVGVVVRDDPESFARDYFGAGSGVWLAYEDESMVGCIALRPLPQLGRAGEIKRMYVKPEARGQGIAERLLKALEEYAAEAGYWALYLDTKDDLTTAIRFYQRHGYEACERYNENPQATMFMRKGLAGD
ncbi:MAG TPA: GNAT family N-acetyltransferase [Acidobacteriaceae bacterium]|nr:GNAT family N-acetyltransferase [Acidobacteriaceae bacterium]